MSSHACKNVDGEENSPLIHEPTHTLSLLRIIKASWFNVLLIFIPLGFVAHFLKFNDTAIFLLNFFAIIPLAKLFEIVIEDISRRTGQV